jgi:arabinose-5-phosphate isomerase
VSDLIGKNEMPQVAPTTPIKDVIIEISKKRLGTTAVVENNKIVGIITDGDLRRMLTNSPDISNLVAENIMGKNPKTINVDAMAIEALETMENNKISQILVEDNSVYVGVVHLHDLIKEGIF